MKDHAEGRMHCKAFQGACNDSSPQVSLAVRRPAWEMIESGTTRPAASFQLRLGPQAFLVSCIFHTDLSQLGDLPSQLT